MLVAVLIIETNNIKDNLYNFVCGILFINFSIVSNYTYYCLYLSKCILFSCTVTKQCIYIVDCVFLFFLFFIVGQIWFRYIPTFTGIKYKQSYTTIGINKLKQRANWFGSITAHIQKIALSFCKRIFIQIGIQVVYRYIKPRLRL